MKLTGLIFILAFIMMPTAWLGAGGSQRPGRGGMKKYEARYHVIYTDLPREKVYEAIVRLDAMAREYHNRTKGFGGKITEKLPFYLHSSYEDYTAACGGKSLGSAGVYTGSELRAVADDRLCSWERIWRIVQHEGFHQFVHMVICRGDQTVPIWLNEGLAEYFGEAIWTGDNMVAGLIDSGATWRQGNKIYTRQGRLQRVRSAIENEDFISFPRMLGMSSERWNAELAVANYDQAWSMVHFFVHAKDGKYRRQLQAYLGDMVKSRPSLRSFRRRFGQDLGALRKEYRQWWLGLGENPTADRYDRAIVEILTSFIARAYLRKIRFRTAEDFFQLARAGELSMDVRKHGRLWLPDSLLERAMKAAKAHEKWEVKTDRFHRPVLKLLRRDGTVFEGSFTVKGRKKIGVVSVKISPPPKAKIPRK